MRARFGVGADFLSDWLEPADLRAYSRLAVLAATSNVAEAHTSTRMDRFMAPHPTFKVSSFYPSKAETKARSVEDATFCARSEEHTSELQSHSDLVCRLLLEKKNLHHQCHLGE